LPLNLRPLPEVFSRRRGLGDSRNVQHNSPVCEQCYFLLTEKSGLRNWWAVWPASFYTALTNNTYADTQTLIEQWMPRTIKNLFRKIETNVNLDTKGIFRDNTGPRKAFLSAIESLEVGRLIDALNRTCVPSTRCPLGCWAHIETSNCIPINHLIEGSDPNFKFCNANSDNFRAKRPDFPNVKYFHGWPIQPAVILHPTKGLCVVVCDDHKTLRKEYIHMPLLPVLAETGTYQGDTPDGNAKIIHSVHSKRLGRKGAMNVSYSKNQQKFTRSGASTTVIAAHDHDQAAIVAPDNNTHNANLTTYYCNEYTRRYTPNNPALDDDYIFRAKALRNAYQPHEIPEILRRYGHTGSFVPIRTALAAAEGYNETSRNAGAMSQVPSLIAYNTKTARPLCKNMFNFRNNEQRDTVMRAVLFYLQHSEPLRTAARVHANENNDEDLRNLIKGALKIDKHNCKKMRDCARRIYDRFIPQIDREGPINEQVVTVITRLLPFVIRHNLEDEEDPALAMAQGDFHIYTNDREYPIDLPDDTQTHSKMCESSSFHNNARNSGSYYRLRQEKALHWQHINEFNGNLREQNDAAGIQFSFALYIHNEVLKGRYNGKLFNNLSYQPYLMCNTHRNAFLHRADKDTKLKCPMGPENAHCNRKLHFICSRRRCTIGLCKKHSNELLQTLRNIHYVGEAAIEDEEPPVQANDEQQQEEDEPEEYLLVEGEVINVEDDDIAGNYPLQADVLEPIPFQTNEVDEPVMRTDYYDQTASGHYLINHDLQANFNSVNKFKDDSVQHSRIMQDLFSKDPSEPHALLYPTAMINPKMYWQTVDGAPVGALPSVMYTAYGADKARQDFANLREHIRVQFRDGFLPNDKDRAHRGFIFDVIVNQDLANTNPIIVGQKGLDREITRGMQREKKPNLQKCASSAAYEARKICASFRDDRPWDYFYTGTANVFATPGVAPINLAIEQNEDESDDWKHQNWQNAMNLNVINYERFNRYFWNYVANSPEKPLGDVSTYWYRYEFQSAGSQGNLPHVHAGITLKPGDTEEQKYSRIECIPGAFYNDKDQTTRHDLFRRGMVTDIFDWMNLTDLMDKVTTHDCQMANTKCTLTKRDGSKICRVPIHDNCFRTTITEKDAYSRTMLRKLRKIGFPEKLPEIMRSRTYSYRNCGSRRSVPINPTLALLTRASTNMQRLSCIQASSYCAKYSAGVEENRKVTLKSNKKDKNLVEPEYDEFTNEKIRSSRCNIMRNQKLDTKTPILSEIAETQMLFHLQGFSYVNCNYTSVGLNTDPYDIRNMSLKRSKSAYQKNVGDDGEVFTITGRAQLPEWRQFLGFRIPQVESLIKSDYYADQMSTFNVRPPELLDVNNPQAYAQWFLAKETENVRFDEDINVYPMYDGLGRVVKCRQKYLQDMFSFISELWDEDLANPTDDETRDKLNTLVRLYSLLQLENQQNPRGEREFSDFYKKFVDVEQDQVVAVVISDSNPDSAQTFLWNYVLQHGRYNCELEVFQGGNIKDAFQRAGLVNDAQNITRREVYRLLKRYVERDLIYSGMTVRGQELRFDKVEELFERVFLNDGDLLFPNPLIDDLAIQAQANEQLQQLENERRENIIRNLVTEGLADCPTEQDLINRTAQDFEPRIERLRAADADGGDQSEASFNEQTDALNYATNAIYELLNPEGGHVNSIVFIGPPGAGKTHLLLNTLLLAIAKDIRVCLTSLTSQRSRSLGGIHLHNIFKIPIDRPDYETPREFADRAVANLTQSPIDFIFLRRTKIFFIEEIGLISASFLTVLDLILRKVKESNQPYGGAIIIATGDNEQLPPIEGEEVWLSSQIGTLFDVVMLQHMVRSAEDQDLQNIITTMRKPELSARDINTVIRLLNERCYRNNRANFYEVRDSVVRIVARKAAVREVTNIWLNKKIEQEQVPHFTSNSIDEAKLPGDEQWQPAENNIVSFLNRNCARRNVLQLFVDMVAEMTENNTRATAHCPVYSKRDKMVVTRIPTQQDETVYGKIIPTGQVFRGVPDPNWPDIQLKKSWSHMMTMGSKQKTHARRKQYPLDYHICTTIHSAMGQTLDQVATSMSNRDKNYRLWDRSQLLVALSRTRSLNNLTIVGNWNENMAAVRTLLKKTSKTSAYIQKKLHILNVIRNEPIARIIPPAPSTVRIQAELPTEKCGFVYMLVSKSDEKVYKVVQCACILSSYTHYNTGWVEERMRCFRPYFIAFYIYGFPGSDGMAIENHAARIAFEEKLEEDRRFYSLALADLDGRELTWRFMIVIARDLVNDYFDRNFPDLKLTMKVLLRERE